MHALTEFHRLEHELRAEVRAADADGNNVLERLARRADELPRQHPGREVLDVVQHLVDERHLLL